MRQTTCCTITHTEEKPKNGPRKLNSFLQMASLNSSILLKVHTKTKAKGLGTWAMLPSTVYLPYCVQEMIHAMQTDDEKE
jgi:hypothetical protein